MAVEKTMAGQPAAAGLDGDLAGFLQGFGGGWAAKVPYGAGALYVHFTEAGRADYRRYLTAKRAGLESLPDNASHPANAAQNGFLARVTIVNLSDRDFILEWTGSGRCFSLSLAMCHNLENLWTPSVEKVWDKPSREDEKYFETDICVRPGERREAYLVFRPLGDIAQKVVHGMHIAMAVVTVPYDFGPELMSAVKGPLLVSFPFHNLDARAPNARAQLEFTFPAGKGFVVLCPFQGVRCAGAGTVPYVTLGLHRISLSENATTKAAVEAICAVPGAQSVDGGRLSLFRQTSSGFRYPRGMSVTNILPVSGGENAPEIPGWESYSYREEKAAREAWDALPVEKKIASAFEMIAQSDIDNRYQGISILGRLGDERVLPHLLKLFDDKSPVIAAAARRAYTDIRGMSYEQEQRIVAEQKAFEGHVAEIARREGRVTYVNIRDSILNRTTLNIEGGGQTHVELTDTVVNRTTVGGDGKEGYTAPQSPDNYQERLNLYEKALKAALKDGTILSEEQRLLDALRKKLGITDAEHEMLLRMHG